MKKTAIWMAIVSFVVFVIDWGIVGLKLLDGDYDITVGAYVGATCLVVLFICILYIKFTHRCQHCGKMIQFVGKYCPHCGKEIK